MKVNANELIGPALDWAVEFAKGTHWVNGYFCYDKCDPDFSYPFTAKTRPYSTDWAKSGPIIRQEKIALEPYYHDGKFSHWIADSKELCEKGISEFHDEDPLVAAMRCFVASKLGEEIEIPEELLS